jgi:hypothetical protein
MIYLIKHLLIIFIILIVFIGCENPSEYEHIPKLTLNGELVAGQTIDSIFISWSADIRAKYDTEDQRVRNAEVLINGVTLLEYDMVPGVYYYPDRNYRVQSGQTYGIEVTSGSERVSSETTVPSPFEFYSEGISEGDTLIYVPGSSWFSEAFFTLIWPGYDNSKIFRIASLADIATDANYIEDDRDEANIFKGEKEDRLNPGMWWVGDIYVRINWMYFNWTGWHSIIVSAMDNNYYDYRNGILFGEQIGQNFNNIIKGGYGLFCSSATDTLRIFVMEQK